MKPNRIGVWLALVVLVPSGSVAAQDSYSIPPLTAAKIARIQRLLADPLIENKGFDAGQSLTRFLRALEKQIPSEKAMSIRFDTEALGDDWRKIADAPIRIPGWSGKRTLHSALGSALKQVGGEVEYGIGPNGVVITRPRLATHEQIYEVRDIVEQMPFVLSAWQKNDGESVQPSAPLDNVNALVRVLVTAMDLRPWETIHILNGIRLVVVASPRQHETIADILNALRRLQDLGVCMNARLYEVDRAFYTGHVAPLFARVKDPEERPAVVRIDAALLQIITQQKLLLESEEIRLRPNQVSLFLAHQNVFRYLVAPPPEEKKDLPPGAGMAVGPPWVEQARAQTGSGLAGVSFAVRPVVSSNRRFLRLQIAQQAAELVGIEKVKKLDVATGKDVEVEVPNVRKSSVTGTVQIPDGYPFLMPVDYRPPGKDNADKVWLLVARPTIWIEAEAELLRETDPAYSPRSVWKTELEEKDLPPAPPPLPLDNKTKEILQAIITDVLTNPDLKDVRESYGSEKGRALALIEGSKLGWPKQLNPATHGYTLLQGPPDPFTMPRRILGIRLDKFDLKQKIGNGLDAPIQVCITSAANDVLGGCLLSYIPKRVGNRWTVQCIGGLDP